MEWLDLWQLLQLKTLMLGHGGSRLVPRRPYLPHPLALCCNYRVSKCPSASIVATSTLRVNRCIATMQAIHGPTCIGYMYPLSEHEKILQMIWNFIMPKASIFLKALCNILSAIIKLKGYTICAWNVLCCKVVSCLGRLKILYFTYQWNEAVFLYWVLAWVIAPMLYEQVSKLSSQWGNIVIASGVKMF